MSEEVSITVGTAAANVTGSSDVVVTAPQTLTGWEDVEITLRAEGFPPTFRFSASSGIPRGNDAAIASAGDAAMVRIGGDLVVTGYLTNLAAQYGAADHLVELIGAGKTQDLIGEIDWDQSRAYLSPSVDAVQTIADYFGIEVAVLGDAGTPPPGPGINVADYPILLDFGTSGADYINEITRILGVLAYEDSRGRLTLAHGGTKIAGSGIVYGENVQAFTIVNSMEGRFSEVRAIRFPQNQYLMGEDPAAITFHTAKDPGVPRRRIKHVVVQNGPDSEGFAARMADWEVARRAARSRQVRVTVDSWRDAAGLLWEPNTIVPLALPGLAADAGPFGLGEVTFRRNNATGTTADMVLLPISGFTPQPVQPTSANLIGIAAPAAAPTP